MHAAHFLPQIVILFGAALAVAWLFRKLHAPSIIGFLFTGIIIGPSALKLITPESVSEFADLGLILLLFAVGLELSPEPLLRAGVRLSIAAMLQIGLTMLLGFFGLMIASSLKLPAVFAIALAITPSSTAIVLKQLGDLRQTDSPMGSTVTGVSLVQDMVVIVMMVLLPLLAGPGEAGWLPALGKVGLALVILAAAALIVRMALPYLINSILKTGGPDLLSLFAVFMACAGAWGAGAVGWSPALGACVAGLLLAETDIKHQLFSEIMPFRDVFNAMFFIAIGMMVNLDAVIAQPIWIATAIVVTLLGKTLLAGLAVLIAGWPLRLAVQVGLGLSTISEFGFVLASEANKLGIFPSGAMNAITAIIVGTMMIGAMFVPVADKIALAVHGLFLGSAAPIQPQGLESTKLDDVQVVIVGYGLNGQNLARVLRATNISFSVIEMNPTLISVANLHKDRVVLGDATRLNIMRHAGIEGARALVSAINDQEATRRIVAQARTLRDDLFILARTRYIKEVDVLHGLGANEVIPEEFETSIEIFTHVLKEFHIPANIVQSQIAMIRAGRYGMLRGNPLSEDDRSELMQLLEATATQTFLLSSASPACGRTLRQLELRAKTGTTIIAVVRGGQPITNPTADQELRAGEVLVMVGSHKQLDAAAALLKPAQRNNPVPIQPATAL